MQQSRMAFVPLGAASACGQAATVLTLAYGDVFLIGMVKPMEPVASAVLLLIFFGECVHPVKYAAIATIVTGVAMCSADHVAVRDVCARRMSRLRMLLVGMH